ncbi:RhuM family protein [Fusobacterium ulcerans]|uniref:RhuM family protein n=1 Tax=Fusobacterium ulcerans TaxID=861 RepID=UPI001D0A3763|nr:virulence protein RhuM/Fic/DOC family protein [Fusobacterium ulcerans]MCB8566303.1 virulence RhuM family protein [Fusobacterium ulcerans]MCB8650394.1 virulence RhuM family protein [Fusobacterium ulcerans]
MLEKIQFSIEDNENKIDVSLNEDSVWLNLNQIAELFQRDKSVISRHIKNIYKTEELQRDSTVAFFATVQNERGRQVKREIEYFNLDMIISIGYRVNSKRGTQFRIWAANILKDYLIKGYTLNEKKLNEKLEKFKELQKTIKVLERTVNNQQINLDEAKILLKVVSEYSYALNILDSYDHQNLEIIKSTERESYKLTYSEVIEIVEKMKNEFTTNLFGKEKDKSLKGSLGAIYQTAFGKDVYPSIEEKAANLLYFIVKNHSFVDGNKRIAAAVFIYFMNANNLLYDEKGSKRIENNTLVAITLMIAESNSNEKDLIIKVLVNLINSNN